MTEKLDLLEEQYLSRFEDLAELSDSSVESVGDLIRTGNVPNEWYEKELHDGYDIDGKKVFVRGVGDNIDQFLASKNKKELKRRIYDVKNDKVTRLNDRDLSIINRLRNGKCASKMYEPGIPETFVFDITTMGIRPKSSFTISKSDYRQILKNVKAIKNGWIKVDKYGEAKKTKSQKKKQEIMRMDPYRLNLSSGSIKSFDVWSRSNIKVQSRQILGAPKSRLPTNYESYNPSSEYLFNEREKESLLKKSESDRNGRIVPIKYDCLRKVPQFDRFINERFERCLDLYLLPRKMRKKSIINPKDLLPKLPSINDLKPFPEILSIEYLGHAQSVRCIDISACGQWIVSGSDDGTIRIFEIDSGREFYRHSFGKNNRIEAVQFNPMQNKQSLLSVVCKHRVFLIPIPFISSFDDHQKFVIEPIKNIKKYSKSKEDDNGKYDGAKMIIPRLNLKQTLALFDQSLFNELSHWPSLIEAMCNEMKWKIPDTFKEIARQIEEYEQSKDKSAESEENKKEKVELNTNDISIASRWSFLTFHSNKSNEVIGQYKLINNNVACISFLNYLDGIKWHCKGDYFATFRSEKERSSLIIHRMSKFESQIPFSKSIGCIQDIVWHPRQPFIYVACKQSIRCFNLKRCKLQEKYSITTNWISRFDLHDSGLNMIVGGVDGKVSWYDMDLSQAPFKTFNYHCSGNGSHCVRNVVFHHNNKFNHLWASCGDDGKIYVFYCKMFRDKFADPILIPLKILDIGKHRFLDIKWHKTQPWIFAACSDGITRLYTAL